MLETGCPLVNVPGERNVDVVDCPGVCIPDAMFRYPEMSLPDPRGVILLSCLGVKTFSTRVGLLFDE